MNTMHKRLLALVLVCALTLGIVPALSLPIFAVDTEGAVYQAAHVDTVALDGARDEAFLLDGRMSDEVSFGVSWNKDALYIAVTPRQGDATLQVAVGDQKLTVTKTGVTGDEGAKSVWGSIVEISMPYTITDYGQSASVSLSMGDVSWAGKVCFIALDRVLDTNGLAPEEWKLLGRVQWNGIPENVLENGYRLSNLYDNSNSETANTVLTNSIAGQFGVLSSRTTNLNMELDFCAEKLPIIRPAKPANNRMTNGFTMSMNDGQGDGFTAGITNSSNGLVFNVLDHENAYSYVELGKKLGDKFHLRVEWQLDGDLAVYVDGVLIKEFERVQATYEIMSKTRGGAVDSCMLLSVRRPEAAKSSSDDMVVYATNITVSKSYDEHPLAGLNFDTIADANKSASQVETDLNLSTTYAHPSGHFPAKEIVWDSAREDYVANDGKVTPHGTPLNVILTACLKDDPSISQQIVVKVTRKSSRFLVVSSDEATMRLDGTMNEGPAVWQTELPMSTTEGDSAPAGTLYGAWGQGKIYVAVKHSGAKNLVLTLNKKVITLDLATGSFVGDAYGAEAKISGGVAEVYVPLQGVGLYAYQYDQTAMFEAKLVGESGTAALYTYRMDIHLTSEVKYEQDLNSGTTAGKPDISADGTSVNLNPAITEQAVKVNGLGAVDRSQDLTITQTILATNIPVSNGGFKSVSDVAGGYHFWVVDGEEKTEKSVLHVKLYNHSAKGLVLQILKDNALAAEEIVLGKTAADDAEAFQLKLVWAVDGSVSVYVDGALKGTVSGVNVTCSDDSMGYDGFQIHCADLGLRVAVSDVTFAMPALKQDLTGSNVLGGASVSEDGNTLTLDPHLIEQGVVINGVADVDHSKALIFSQEIRINALDVSAGGFKSVADTADGYNFWVVDGEAGTTQSVLRAKIYNHSARGLTLQILKNSDLEIAEVALDKAVGDVFQLSLQWNTDNTVKVSVDGALKGTVGGVELTCEDGSMGFDGFQLRCVTDGAKIVISNVSFSRPAEQVGLADSTVSGATISADGNSATLELNAVPQNVQMNGLAELDHSKDLIISQTVMIESMVATAGGFNSLTDVAGGYHFWFVDGEENTTQYLIRGQIYNSENGLILQIVKNNQLAVENIPLGLNVGQGFTLKFVWGKDNSLAVYVDDVLKNTITDLSLTCEDGSMGHDGFQMHCTADGTKMTVSDIAIVEVGTTTVFPQTFENASLHNAELNAEKTVAIFQMAADGTDALSINGLSEMDHTQNILFKQTITVEAMAASTGMAASSSHGIVGDGYYFWLIDGASGAAKTLTFANLYNHATKGLVLQVEHANGQLTEIVLGKQVGDTFTLGYLWGKNNTVQVFVDGKFAGACNVSTTWAVNYVADGRGYDGYSLRTNKATTKVQVTDVEISYAQSVLDFTSTGKSNASLTNSGTTVTLTGTSYIGPNGLAVIDHSKDLLLEQIICVNAMSENSKMTDPAYNVLGSGYYFWMTDGESGAAKKVSFANIYNAGGNTGLVMQVEHGAGGYTEISLGKKVGETFKLGYLWKTDNTAEVYVNDELVGTCDVSTTWARNYTADGRGYDALQLRTNDSAANVTVSNVTISKATASMLPTIDLSSATKEGNPAVSASGVNFTVQAAMQSVAKNDIDKIDHSKDLLFTQKLHVEAMPVGRGMVVSPDGHVIIGTSYYFWIIDGEQNGTKTLTFANMYNAGGETGLVLQVEHADGKFTDIPLGKKVGDTFELGYLWGKDNTVQVYVDNVYVGACTVSATWARGYVGSGRGWDGFAIRSTVGGVKVNVSDLSFAQISVKQNLSSFTLAYAAVNNSNVASINRAPGYIEKGGMTVIDHSKDIMLTHTVQLTKHYQDQPIDVDNALVSTGAYQTSASGYSFMLVDGAQGEEKTITFANIYNHSEKGLVMQVEHADGTFSEVALNKSLTDTFELGYLWGKDGSATVYVDGVKLGTFQNVDYTGHGKLDNLGYDNIRFARGGANTRAYVSNVMISVNGVLTPVANTQNLAVATKEGNVTLKSNEANFDVKSEKQSMIVNGVDAVDSSANLMFNQTIKVEAMAADKKMEPGENYNIAGTGYYFWLVSGDQLKEGEKTNIKSTTFANMYNDSAKGLVLQVQTGVRGEGFEDVVLGKQVGDTFTLGYYWKTDRTIEVYVDGALVGTVAQGSYSRMQPDSRGYDGYQIHSSTTGTKVQVSDINIALTYVQNMARVTKEGDVTTKNTTATFNMKATTQSISKNEIAEMDHSRDLTLSQTIRVDAMPLDQKMEATGSHSLAGTSYHFWMTDGATGEAKAVAAANLYNSSKNGLVLQVESSGGTFTDVVLGKKVGETFVLDFMWCADDSVKIFVDGKLVGTCPQATWKHATNESRGQDALNIRASAEGVLKMSVSNVYLTPGTRYDSVFAELTPEAVLKGITEIDNVTQTTLKLPEFFNSPYLGKVPLTWVSGDPDIINVETGKVNHSNKKVGTYVTLTATIKDYRDRQLFKIEVYVTGNGKIEIKSPSKLTAAFTDNVVIDGKFTAETDGKVTEEGWQISTLLGETGRLGAQWDTKNLYLAVKDLNPAAKNELSITLKGNVISLSNAVTVDGVTEIAIPMSSLGIYADNYGIGIPAKVQLGEGVWEGTIVLSSTDWFSTDTTYPRLPNPASQNSASALAETPRTDFQGATKLDYGFRFYDLYNIKGTNPHSIRTTALMVGVLSTQQPWEFEMLKPMANTKVALFAEFDFQAMMMPEYILGTAEKTNALFATCGYYWYWGREQSQGAGPTISMGIINTSDGLYFVARGQRGDTFVRLGKELGDYFRVGTRWDLDGSVTLYIDGEEIQTIDKVEKISRAVNCGACLGTIRSEDAATSSNQNIDVYVYNIAIGQNYGDTLLDTLTFNDIRGKNGKDMGAVTRDLKLADTWSTAQLPTPQKITWTSSDPSVLNAETGDVIRPEGNGKPVTLTATCGSETKVFELFVKGLNPDGLVMFVQDDRNTATGVGKPENEKHIVTLDTDNNSIILDQGETKKINVIELIDSDAVNRLNESTLTIWYSDDNETYTKMDGYFKILRDGTKTYLYDFEIEARYIKVHCTHYNGAEADMINVLKDMIKVDYVSVFGDGDAAFATTSTVMVANDKDNTIYDQFFVISPADAGVACVKEDKSDARFFLDDELLYHYFDGTNFVVRVTKIPAKGEVALTVLSGNAEAMNIDNKEYVYEVAYGTREGIDEDIGRWLLTLPDGTLMSVKGTGTGTSGDFKYRISTNAGMTWSAETLVEAATNFITVPQGIVYDDQLGRIIVQGRIKTAIGGSKTRFVYTDDLGQTWKQCPELIWLGKSEEYVMSYCDPLLLSTRDGEGPNVDVLLPLAIGTYDTSIKGFEGFVRVAYSCDGGITWTVGEDEVRYTKGEGLFDRENGINESTMMEDENGRIVLISRCQYGNVDQFSVVYSYDNGLTWESANGKGGEAQLSTIYTDNTQPIAIDYNGYPLMTWGGNNVLGGNSYMRFPFNVAVSYDNMETFENIQDMYSRYSMQGVTMSTRTYITNQSVEKVGDSLVMIWNADSGALTLRVDNFTDYFYRTRGAYDSFENTTVKYEGWATGAGSAEVSGEQFTDGSKSMKIGGASAVVRSVPYVQTGSVSFDLYLEDVNAAEMQIELESAYGTIYGKAAPVAMTIRGGKLYFLAADRTQAEVEIAANLRSGWNHFEFDLDLVSENPGVTLAVNGGEATAVPTCIEIGDYVTFVHVATLGKAGCYMDSFHLVDNDNAYYPETEIKAEYSELAEVPEELKASYSNVKSMTDAMMNALVEANENGYTAQGSAAYDVKVLLTRDNGKTWAAAENDDIPNEGVVVKIPYPKNTTKESHTFSAVMMPVMDSYRLGTKAGEAKILTVSAEADAVYVTVVGSAPVLLTWVQTGDAPISNNGGSAWIFIVIGVLAVLAAAAVVILVIRKKRASTPVIVADEAEEIAAEEAPAEENENEVNNEEET